MPARSKVFVALLLAANMSLPAGAVAQPPAGSPAPMHQGDMHSHATQSIADRVELRIADVRAKLHITPEQQSLWDPFAQVMRDNAEHMHQAVDARAAKISTMNASENMQSYAQIATQRAQDLQNLAAAFQPLYVALSQDQQRTADAMFRDVGMHPAAGHHR